MNDSTDSITILHVDDEPDLAELTAICLGRIDERFVVETTESVRAGLDRIAETELNCVVSDYDMPDRSGLDFLRTVRRDHPELPFILFTGKGSEEVASDAMAAGVTDYLQKRGGTDQYELLANRVINAVEKWRAEEQANLWAHAMESAVEGIAIIDSEGRYSDLNDEYAELHDAERADIIGESWTAFIPDEEAIRAETEIFPRIEETGSWTGESIGKRADGSVFPKLSSVARLDDGGYVCFNRDISEQRAQEAELRRNDATLSVLFGQSPDMISIHDAEGKLLNVNNQLCEELGYSEAELIGKPVWKIDHELTPEVALDSWASMDPGEFLRIEAVFQRRDGSTFPTEVHLTKIEQAGEERFFVISRNISERKEHEELLNRQNENLEEFASIVSHDLRNPLNVAAGQLELARDGCDSEYLDGVERSHDRMEMLIDDLLTIAQQGDTVTETETIDLTDLARRCWQTVATAEATLEPETNLVIRADRSRLMQLLENLICNAVEHGGEDVTVRVGGLVDGFSVEDDGKGIPEAVRDPVFEQGYTTAAEGTGFGLKIVNQIADAHGWDVRVATGTTGGARFEITGVDVE